MLINRTGHAHEVAAFSGFYLGHFDSAASAVRESAGRPTVGSRDDDQRVFDSSTSAAPAGFFTAFNDVIQFFEASFRDPITINLRVGWGTINGFPLDPGALGESSSMQQQFFTYDQIKSALIGDAKSADDITSIAHLPATDPTGGAHFTLTNAQAKALGLLGANLKGLDGAVGFDSSAAYTFDPNNRGVPGEYDFLGVASHDITEVMGRYGLGENGFPTDHYSPLDLFRYTSPGGARSRARLLLFLNRRRHHRDQRLQRSRRRRPGGLGGADSGLVQCLHLIRPRIARFAGRYHPAGRHWL
jgi:hypothetical protein